MVGNSSHRHLQHQELTAAVYRLCQLCAQVQTYTCVTFCGDLLSYVTRKAQSSAKQADGERSHLSSFK